MWGKQRTRSARVVVAALGAAAVTVVAATGSGSASAAPSAAAGVRMAVAPVTIYAGQATGAATYVADDTAVGKVATATFNVTYTGFTPQAKAAFQRAVDYWSTQLTSSVPITVDARFSPLGSGILGSAGPSSVWRDFPGAPKAKTWYVDAVANKRHGSQLDGSADIVANFSSNFTNWSYGTGQAPNGKYDFQTVVTHELGHGLGFLGLGAVSGGQGTVRLQGFPTGYDQATELTTGKKLLSYPDNSAALASALQGGKVVLDTAAVRSANGGKAAKLYAPNPFQRGSSYSHLDEATFAQGNANSLMTPILSDGETIRTQGGIIKAIFKAVGW